MRLSFDKPAIILLLAIAAPAGSLAQEPEKKQPAPEKRIPRAVGKATSPKKGLAMVEIDRGSRKVSVSARLACYQLGRTLGFVMLLRVTGSKPAEYAPELERAATICRGLKFELPTMPKIDSYGDIWDARDYLFEKSGKSIHDRVESQHGKAAAALFNLGAEAVMCKLLYSADISEPNSENKKKINQMLADKLKVAVVQAEMKRPEGIDAIRPLVSWIEKTKPAGRDFTKTYTACSQSIISVLMKEMAEDRVRSAGLASSANKQRGADPAIVRAPKTRMDLEAEALLKKFIDADHPSKIRKLTLNLRPTKAACDQLLEPKLAAVAAKAYGELYDEESTSLMRERFETEFILRKISTDELRQQTPLARQFPGGYKSIAPKMNKGFTLYEVRFVRPGETTGMRYDGLVKIDKQWFWFPKIWRLLDDSGLQGKRFQPLPPKE